MYKAVRQLWYDVLHQRYPEWEPWQIRREIFRLRFPDVTDIGPDSMWQKYNTPLVVNDEVGAKAIGIRTE